MIVWSYLVNFNLTYLPHGFGFLCSRRGSNLLFPAHCLLSKKLVAALIVTGESGAETIADNNSKTIHIFPPGEYFSSYSPNIFNLPSKTTRVILFLFFFFASLFSLLHSYIYHNHFLEPHLLRQHLS